MKNLLTILFLCLGASVAFSQSFIRGTVTDEKGEPAMFANVVIDGTTTGTQTDLDGKYSIEVEPGTYAIVVSYVGYDSKKVENIIVNTNEVTLVDINISSSSIVTDELVIETTVVKTAETYVNLVKSKAAVPLDGVNSQTLRRIGASNGSDAVKAVTGVSVQGGKYVFVRGLGDRYTKTLLNGMDIPGLDPDRNTIQMDIFPTSILDNIFVYKAFSPDLPGDFAGGVVNLLTKEFPEEKTLRVSMGFGFNPTMHFQDNAPLATGSSTDWLGFDNGLRSLPIAADERIPDPFENNPRLTEIIEGFNPELATTAGQTPMNFNFSISTGNQINKEKVTFGYNAALNYRNTTNYFEEVEINAFWKNDNTSEYDLLANRIQRGSLVSNNVMASALLGGSAKWGDEKISSKITANLLRIQNGESTSGNFSSETIIGNSVLLLRDNIEYNERAINNALLKGFHSINKGDIEVEWSVSPTISTIYDKDVRVTPLRFDNNQYDIKASEGAVPERFWRNLEEENYTARIDVTKKINLSFYTPEEGGKASKIKAGFSNAYKHRDYEILAYRTRVTGDQFDLPNPFYLDGDANKILSTDNIWRTGQSDATYIFGNYEVANTYDAIQNIMAGYLMGDLAFSENLRAIVGVRTEAFDHTYTGRNQSGEKSFDAEKIIDVVDFLPSANVVYTIPRGRVESMNFRAGFARTLARPSFKEASIAEIFDAISGRTFIGNIDLQTTDINNYDVRWEYFFKRGQMISVSGFYKQFFNPIELTAFDAASPNQFTPRNVGNATVLGVEFEAKKDFGFINENLQPLSIGTNVTLVKAEVEMSQEEFDGRANALRDGETMGTTRPMQGQSPYIINGFLNYVNRTTGLEGNISYNVQGPSLFIVGINIVPDVYQLPFHSLNFKISKTFGNTVEPNGDVNRGPHNVSLRVTNLLNQKRQNVYQSFNPAFASGYEQQLFDLFAPARTISVGYSYRIF